MLTEALSGVDPHFTKTTLEHVERELSRHVDRLAAAQQTAQSRPAPLDAEPVPGPSGLAVSARPVVSVEEESSGPSQYVTAVSVSSLEVEERPWSGSFVQPPPPPANDVEDQHHETAI